MTPVAARRAPVTVRTEPAAVVLELADLLDADAGAALVAAAEAALATRARAGRHRPHRASSPGPRTAPPPSCGAATVCGDLPDGLHYRTGRGPGRAALLAAYT